MISAQTRPCTKCGEIKPLDAFYARKDRPGKYTSACKACACRAASDRCAAAPKKPRARMDPSEAQARRRERDRARSRRNREAGRSYVVADPIKRRRQKAEAMRRYRATHPGRVAVSTARCKRRLPQMPWVHQLDVLRIYREAAERAQATGVPHEVDHLYPAAGGTVCGLDVPANMRVVTASLNRKKYNKLPGCLAGELWDPQGEDVFHE